MSVVAWRDVIWQPPADQVQLSRHLVGSKQDFEREAGRANEAVGAEPESGGARFAIDESLSAKVKLVKGSPRVYADLRVQALVNRTNARLDDWTGLSSAILQRAGATLREECSYVITACQTGECKITRGCQLSAAYVIHTVVPKYTDQYHTAAETALHSCYKSAISLAMEQGIRSIAFPCLHMDSKDYPPELGAHTAVRTVRRFLEHFGSHFDHVVFYVESDHDLEIYKRTLALYFPRNSVELAWSKRFLPDDVGNEWGEIIPADREIRIARLGGRDNPFNRSVAAERTPTPVTAPRPCVGSKGPLAESFVSDADVVAAAQAAGSADSHFEEVIYGTEVMVDNANYKRYLERAKFDDLKDMFALNIVYQSGEDDQGRPIIVWVVANMNVPGLDLERLFLHTILVCDKLVTQSRGYVLVILDDSLAVDAVPAIGWIKSLYEDVIGRKYKKNIKAMYVVHPTAATKMLFWAATPFVSSKFWSKHCYVESLQELYHYVPPDRLVLPKVVYQADARAKAAREASWF